MKQIRMISNYVSLKSFTYISYFKKIKFSKLDCQTTKRILHILWRNKKE